MPTFEITAPDGSTWEVDAPEGSSEQQVLDFAKQHWSGSQGRAAVAEPVRKFSRGSYIPSPEEAPGGPLAPAARPSRLGDSLAPVFGGHNPVAETYDTFVDPFVPDGGGRSPEDVEWMSQRLPLERMGDTAAAMASLPGRMLTKGEAGIGDSIGIVAPEIGESINRAEADFYRANAPQVEAVKAAGELALGVPMLSSMGHVPSPMPAPVIDPLRQAAAAAKGRALGFQTRGDIRQAPTRNAARARIEDAQAMRDIGVEPVGPVLSGTTSGAAIRQMGDALPIAGAPIANRLREGVAQTRKAAERIAGQYGPLETFDEGGRLVARAIERFKDARPQEIVDEAISAMDNAALSRIIASRPRDTSLKTRSAALYERAWRLIPEEMRNGRSVQGERRYMGGLSNARETLSNIIQRNMQLVRVSNDGESIRIGPDMAANLLPLTGGLGADMLRAILVPNRTVTLQTMRDMRSTLRRIHSKTANTEGNVMSRADLERLNTAITRDMVGLLDDTARRMTKDAAKRGGNAAAMLRAQAAAARRSITMFRRADSAYQRNKTNLERIEKLFNTANPEAISRILEHAALNRGSGNLNLLREARRVLRDSEWDEYASSVLHEIGTPKGGARGVAREQGFSVASALTRWNNMSDEAKAVLFNSRRNPALRQELDKLFRVIGRFAEYEALANNSRTATNAIAIGAMTGGLVLFWNNWQYALMAAGGTYAVSKFLSSQAYVRWLTRAAVIQKMEPKARAKLWGPHIEKLKKLASEDRNVELGASVLRAAAVLEEQPTDDQPPQPPLAQ